MPNVTLKQVEVSKYFLSNFEDLQCSTVSLFDSSFIQSLIFSVFPQHPLLTLSFPFLLPSVTDVVKMSLSLPRLVLMVGLVLMLTAFITGQTDGYRTKTDKCGRTHM